MSRFLVAVAAIFALASALPTNKTTYKHSVLFPGEGLDLCVWFAFDNITAIDAAGTVYDMSVNATIPAGPTGSCSYPVPAGNGTTNLKWAEFLSFTIVNANATQQLTLQLSFAFNATFDAQNSYISGNNATTVSQLQLTFATLDKEGNVTSSSTATFSKLGNQSMYAAYDTSYQCVGAFNYTADAVDAEAGAKKYAPILSIVDVGMQSFIPLGKKTPSPAFGDAVCPHIVNKRNTIGLIVGGGIAGIAFVAIFVFAFSNCKKSQKGYQSLDAV